jgi:hypothetical protein
LGARVTGLVELADTGLSSNAAPRAEMMQMRSFAAAGSAPPELDLEPQRQQVRATIEARFTISEPTVLSDPVD